MNGPALVMFSNSPLLVLLENEFARTLKEKEELFSSTVEEMKAKLYETESRNKGTTCVILLILNDYYLYSLS